GARGQSNRFADLPHGGRVPPLLHRLFDEVEDPPLPRRDLVHGPPPAADPSMEGRSEQTCVRSKLDSERAFGHHRADGSNTSSMGEAGRHGGGGLAGGDSPDGGGRSRFGRPFA